MVTAVFEAPLAQGMIRVTEALNNDDAVRCGELKKRRVALKVNKRRFNLGQYSEAFVCEEADLLTLRRAEHGTQKSRSIALKR